VALSLRNQEEPVASITPSLARPRCSEVKKPITAITAEIMNALLMPSTNDCVAMLSCEIPTPVKREDRRPAEAAVATTAPISARLRDCPQNLIVPSVPLATPSLPFSTEPITALVFGEEKSPIPMPMTDNPAII